MEKGKGLVVPGKTKSDAVVAATRVVVEAGRRTHPPRSEGPRTTAKGVIIGRNNANCNGCGSRWDNKQTARRGSFKPNAFGLFDMLGNVWEWTCSEYKKHYDGSEQKCSVSAKYYSLRGGSLVSNPRTVRSANRLYLGPDFRFYFIGFRLAQD